ncbi:MAG: DUF4294 domain-containing protein [Bacteroidales bacterium]|nr:DUF4294 domain-containing protein [Bacteroidales bacterium]
MHRILVIFVLSCCSGILFAQDTVLFDPDTIDIKDFEVIKGIVLDGKKVPHSVIRAVQVFPRREFENKRQARRYGRLVRNLKKVYPYAKLAKRRLYEMEVHMMTLESDRGKRKYINRVEEELKEEFEDDLRQMTFTQGRLLIKLIDRETGETTYKWIKELKGSFSAFFWQAIARVFGSNLKTEFDTHGEDRVIDEILILIEMGII